MGAQNAQIKGNPTSNLPTPLDFYNALLARDRGWLPVCHYNANKTPIKHCCVDLSQPNAPAQVLAAVMSKPDGVIKISTMASEIPANDFGHGLTSLLGGFSRIGFDLDLAGKGDKAYPDAATAELIIAAMPVKPTMVFDSGSGGKHLWFIFNFVPIDSDAKLAEVKWFQKLFWQAFSDAVRQFKLNGKPCEVDKLDSPGRILRAPFSTRRDGNQVLPYLYADGSGAAFHPERVHDYENIKSGLFGMHGPVPPQSTYEPQEGDPHPIITEHLKRLGIEDCFAFLTHPDYFGWEGNSNTGEVTRVGSTSGGRTGYVMTDGRYLQCSGEPAPFRQLAKYTLANLYAMHSYPGDIDGGANHYRSIAKAAHRAEDSLRGQYPDLGECPFDAVEIVAGRDLPVLRNAEQAGKEVRKLAVVDVHQQLLDVTGDVFFNWHGFLVTRRDADSVFQFKNSVEFFGWLATIFDVRWMSGGSAIPKNEFYEWVLHKAKPIDDIEVSPHFPPVPRVLYLHEPILLGDGYELEKFMALWSPTTPQDKQLILALLMSVFWGGKPGARPFFLVKIAKGKKVGGGKSTLIEAVGRVANRGREGYYTMSQSADSDAVFKRLLTPTPRSKRVVLLDNMKTFVLGGQELEAVVTCRTINGHRMYVGDGERDNYLVWTGTTNQTKLSDDLADRAVVIHLNSARTKYGADFEARLNAIDYDKLARDVMALFARRPAAIAAYSRRAAWDRDILSRLDAPDELIKLIATRSRLNNDTIDQADMLRETIVAQLRLMNRDPDTAKIFIPVQQLTSWVGGFQLGSSRAVNTPKGLRVLVDQLGSKIKELSTAPSRKHGRGYYWTGVHAYANLAYDLSLVFP